jgi:hypothetical protein
MFRDEHTANPDNFTVNIKWQYEPSTATSGLRNHIKKYHVDQYKQLCKEHKIDPHESIVGKSTTVVAGSASSTREPFTSESLLKYIRNFVISDDQVSLKISHVHQLLTVSVHQCH